MRRQPGARHIRHEKVLPPSVLLIFRLLQSVPLVRAASGEHLAITWLVVFQRASSISRTREAEPISVCKRARVFVCVSVCAVRVAA